MIDDFLESIDILDCRPDLYCEHLNLIHLTLLELDFYQIAAQVLQLVILFILTLLVLKIIEVLDFAARGDLIVDGTAQSAHVVHV